jgi:N-formylglutamate amidohydrolase
MNLKDGALISIDKRYLVKLSSYFVLEVILKIGSSPLIVSVPHDGFAKFMFDGLIPRREGDAFAADRHVWPVVKDVLLQTDISYVIMGLMPRQTVEYNRSLDDDESNPLASSDLLVFYQTYHDMIASRARELRDNWGDRCLLVDFHGFTGQPDCGEYDLVLGTNHCTTCSNGADGDLANFMRQKGYRVFLPTREAIPGERYPGAHTVQYYASLGIESLQIEIHKSFRVREGESKGKKLAEDFSSFFNTYIAK